MEARLAKMRIVGLKYNGGEINIGNMNYDFTTPSGEYSIPNHSLYTLRNGGGKGVFLQSLFQPLEPLTAWNEEEKSVGNMVHHYFYNADGNPVDYTFHILEEWRVSATKNLMLGISVCPTINRREYRKSAIDLKYILFSRIYSVTDTFAIEDLPLWDEEEQKSVPMDEWRKYLNQMSDITTYTMHDQKHYMALLDENGINKHAISAYKDMNSKEGNMSTFFKGATDNIGIFHKMIIPTLNDKVEGIDSRNKEEISTLTKTFYETLKVAKELPQLLSMLQSVEEIHEHLEPINDLLQRTKSIQCELETMEQEGKHIVNVLIQIQETKQKLIQEKEQLLEKIDEDLLKAEWSKENLTYIELQKKLNRLNDEYETMENEQKVKDLKKREVEDNLNKAKVNALLKEYYTCKDKIIDTETDLQTLEQDTKHGKTHDKIQEITEYFKKEWPNIERNWKNGLTVNYRINKAHTRRIKTLKKNIETEGEINKNLEFSILKMESDITAFNQKEQNMVNVYGEDIRLFLDDVIAKEKEGLASLEAKKTNLEKSINHLQEEVQNLYSSQGAIHADLDNLDEKLKKMVTTLLEVQNKEEKLLPSLETLVKEKLEEPPTRTEYLILKQKALDKLEMQERVLVGYEVEFKKLEESFELIREGQPEETKNFYIPNKELVELKKTLAKHNISAVYGAEYLHSLDSEVRMKMLNQNPSLPYSIVVLHERFAKIDFSFLSEHLYRNHVMLIDGVHKIFLAKGEIDNNTLLKTNENAFLPKDKTFDFFVDPHAYKTYSMKVEQDYDEMNFTLDGVKDRIANIKDILFRLESLLGSRISKEIEAMLVRLRSDYKRLQLKQEEHQNSIKEWESKIKTRNNELKDILKKLKISNSNIDQLLDWEQKCIHIDRLKIDLRDNENEFQSSNQLLTDLKAQLSVTDTRLNNIKAAFNDWQRYVNDDFNSLKSMVRDIQKPQPDKSDFHEKNYLTFKSFGKSMNEESIVKIRQYKTLTLERGNQQSQIGKYLFDLDHYRKAETDFEDQLNELDFEDWRNKDCPKDDKMVLKAIINNNENELTIIEQAINKIHAALEANSDNINDVTEELDKKREELKLDYPDFGAVYEDITEINFEREKIKKQQKEHRKLKKDIETIILESRKYLSQTDTLVSTLAAFKIMSDPKVHVLSEDQIIQLQSDPMTFYAEWQGNMTFVKDAAKQADEDINRFIMQIKQYLDENERVPFNYKHELTQLLERVREADYEQGMELMNSYFAWAQNCLKTEKEQKEKAEESVNFWVERTTKRMMDIILGLQDMEKKMKVKNWKGVLFPLIQFTRTDAFAMSKEDIRFRIKDFCISKIDNLVKKYHNLESLDINIIAKDINASNILLNVLGEYPRLNVYIPSIEGPLLRGEPKSLHFRDWEAINNGSVTSPTKSGGQTLLAQLIVTSMLLRQRSANDDSWLFLVSDNPLGTMSAPELIEATFSLLELLKIQWLVVSPPTHVNAHISSKFNTVFHMDLEIDKGKMVLTKNLTKRKRKFLENINILDEKS